MSEERVVQVEGASNAKVLQQECARNQQKTNVAGVKHTTGKTVGNGAHMCGDGGRGEAL
jgi:hypothetical protein